MNLVTTRKAIGLLLMMLLGTAYVQASEILMDFSFSKNSRSQITIKHPLVYESKAGYGFDLGTEGNLAIVKGKKGYLSSNKPFYFSAQVPEGNYKITITYKNIGKTYISTVRSESRRLQLENEKIDHKTGLQRSFVVHIKSPEISAGRVVGLKKPREVEKLDWDNKLTLEFQGENHIERIRIEKVNDAVTVFLAGNSTVVNQEDEPWASWGQIIPRFFDTHVAVANHAESGLSLGSFLSSRRLEKILSVAKPGDYLFVEFGHNDQKEKGENAGAYKSYSERLRLFVDEFRSKGGVPVIVTSTARRSFDANGTLIHTLGDFPDAARKVAAELQVPLIDLNEMTSNFYTALGVEGSKNALVHYPANTFPNQTEALQDNTHFNTYGAYQIAKMVLQGIVSNDIALKKYVTDFSRYEPAKPDAFQDWYWPLSIKNSVVKPDGN
ncbi:rhamnogalacturonan acetylesterase [Sphingobacterium pedocola]|uniref:Rhamnogalacturonan acetylesterase n=1 Tax=Sphingobacterium pedocola TaxID=2082722 RepID=A0ABR9T934_9SPHI|nr:rhamnogalacturonan acetylesterase [Sphingobacterium pedocola]MBE8721862.1 rhamnogalacturonan acetylesterase [Sphingobacterium pedocola]